MTFATLIGFLGLIGIPILIIIYILKPKFIERKISSTYIWKLSLKYRKRKIPLQWLKSFLLIVQCFVVAILAFLLATPRIEETAIADESFIGVKKVIMLDASSSMNTEINGVTRFERAKEQINQIAETNAENAEMTLLTITDKVETIFSDLNNASTAKSYVNDLKCSNTDANYSAAVSAVLQIVKSGDKVRVVMFTDMDFEKNEDGTNGFIEVRNMSDEENEWNVAITDGFEAVISESTDPNVGSKIMVMKAVSYNRDVTVVPCCEVILKSSDGKAMDPKYVKLKSTTIKKYDKDQYSGNGDYTGETTIVFDYDSIKNGLDGKRLNNYKSLRFYFEDASGNRLGSEDWSDSFVNDNQFCVFKGDDSKFDVLVVDYDEYDQTRSFIYMVAAAASGSDFTVTFRSPKVHKDQSGVITSEAVNDIPLDGYDLYIYDKYKPETLPNDGAILIVDPQNVDYGLPFTVGGTVKASGSCTPSADSGLPTIQGGLAKIKATAAGHDILYKVKPNADTIYSKNGENGVFLYTQYTTVNDANAEVLIETEDGHPLIITGVAENRVKYTVFNFDLSLTDLPMVFDAFPQIVNNLLNYSTSRILDSYQYAIGDTFNVGIKPNTTEVVVASSSGNEVLTLDGLEYEVKGGGEYTIMEKVVDSNGDVIEGVDANGNPDDYALKEKFFVPCDPDESNFNKIGPTLVNAKPEVNIDATGDLVETKDYTDLSKYFAAALIVFLLIEWGLQYREQY